MVKKQQGVALIVALIVTAIVGIIAVSLSSTAFRTQRSQNFSVGTVTSHSNAVSGINRAINFMRASALQQEQKVFDVNNGNVVIIDGEVRNIPTIFKGVEQQIADDLVNVTRDNGQNLWYRAAAWLNGNLDCNSCVQVSPNVMFRIEKRDCKRPSGASVGPAEAIPCNQTGGHRMFRITAIGTDGNGAGPSDTTARTIIQTHVGIRDIE